MDYERSRYAMVSSISSLPAS